jgi:hypothetical protein
MLDVAKKKPAPAPAPDPDERPAMTFRPDRPELFPALDRYAASIRRSRTMAMILLLEEVLTAKGFWPPKK